MNKYAIIFSLISVVSIFALGAGNTYWTPSGVYIVVTSWNDEGLWIIDARTGEIDQLEIEGLRGRYVNIGDNRIFAKTITPNGQIPIIYNITSGQVEYVSDAVISIGSPFPTGDKIACAVGDRLNIFDRSVSEIRSFTIEEAPHEFDSHGNTVLWASADGIVMTLDISTGEKAKYPAPVSMWHPLFIHDEIHAEGSDGNIWQYSEGKWEIVCEGRSPVAYRDGIIVTRTTSRAMEIVESDIYFVRDDIERRIDDGDILIDHVDIHPEGKDIAFVDRRNDNLYVAELDGMRLHDIELLAEAELFTVETSPRPRPAEPMLNNYAPYLHQVYDTPDDFDGSWSCGPSSCMMAQGKYEILPHHDITCSSPYSHTSHWGWYINNEYSFNGYTYDILGLAAGDVWVTGAHGFICREYGGAVWAYMQDWLNQHTLTSTIDYSPTWSEYTAEIDGGYVVVASNSILGLGHIILFKGYNADHSFWVNDPWGNANTSPYMDYDGADAILDWPGYDNGHVQPTVNGLITSHGSGLAEPDTIVDDQTTGFDRYGSGSFWWDDVIGWESHMWFTYSTNATDTTNDTCYTTWTPILPDRRYYEVFAYIPNNHAVASAKYRVYHDLGMTQSIIRQADYFNEWVSLGTFMCEASAGSWVYLGDGTGASGEQIGFDAIKWSDRGALPAPDTLVGLFSDGFRWGGPIKWRRIVTGGTEGTFYWTGSITSTPDVNSGTWTPILPESGEYNVYAYIPSTYATADAIYHIHHSSGEATQTIDQTVYGDEWVLLGRWTFDSGSSNYVYLGDYTGASGNSIGYDAVVWRSVELSVEDCDKPDGISPGIYPNPFNSAVTIDIGGIDDYPVIEIRIYDIKGQTIINKAINGDNRKYIWRPSENIGNGIYFVKLSAGGYETSRKLIYLK